VTNGLDLDRERLREAMRTMLLPIAAECEDGALGRAAQEMSRLGVKADDHAAWISLEREKWRDGGEPTQELEGVTAAYLATGDSDLSDVLADAYFDLYELLRGRYLLSHDEACAFLSYARLIAHLAEAEEMSSAQIERVLRARDERVDFSWRAVQRILGQLGLKPALDGELVQELFALDQELEKATFADADIETCAMMLGETAERLGFPVDLEDLAKRLYWPDGTTFGPYLQILHFLCSIAEFYDHALSVLYEFTPRGAVAGWLFDQYPSALTGAGNPVLNNAKGSDQLTSAWAASREDRLDEARALVALISGLESMGFSARRELASWLRRWLVRLIRLTEPLAVLLPNEFSPKQIERILDGIATTETNTQGIIEQRVVDALTSESYPEPAWRARGLGDSVNASNVSRRKLGDCDFQNAEARRVIAWEAHAGRLTEVYVEGHERTLGRLLRLRREEFEGIADPSEWAVEVVFVGHDLQANLPTSYTEEEIAIEITYQDYTELRDAAPEPEELVDAFSKHVNAVLNQKRTPTFVRERLRDLAGPAT
jgi:hypothetical protein